MAVRCRNIGEIKASSVIDVESPFGNRISLVEWRIPHFFSLSTYSGNYYKSHSFQVAGASWYMHILPDGDLVRVYIGKEASADASASVKWGLGLVRADGTLETEGVLYPEPFGPGKDWRLCYLRRRSDIVRLRSDLAPADVLTFVWSFKVLLEKQPRQLTGEVDESSLETTWQCNSEKRPEEFSAEKDCYKARLKTLLRDFNDLLTEETPCDTDTTLLVEGKTFDVHRNVLTSSSSVFAAILEHHKSENKRTVVHIPNCNHETFSLFLEFLYSEKSENVPCRTALQLYSVAHRYDVPELERLSKNQLLGNLTVEDFVDAVKLADLYGDWEMIASLQGFFDRSFRQIISRDDWQGLVEQDSSKVAKRLLASSLSRIRTQE